MSYVAFLYNSVCESLKLTTENMGQSGSKRRVVEGLSEEQKSNIFKMFDVRSRDRVPVITSEMLQSVWKGIFSDGLLTLILRYLFRTTKERDIEDLELLFYQMVVGTMQERALLLISILGIGDSIPPKNFEKYVSYLIESYLNVLRMKNPLEFSSWKSGDLTEKNDITIVAKYLIREINYVEGRIILPELERWLTRCSFVAGVFQSVMNYAFNMEIEQLLPMLPIANKHSSLLRVPTALALSDLTRAYSNNVWRLLYCSNSDANSWNIIQRKIFGQGPTIVLVQDAAGPLFGGFASQSWKIWPTYYGDDACFLFRLRPEMVVCHSTGYNKNFQYSNDGAATLPNGMGMGGQLNYFGFFLTTVFGQGSVSKTCTTFKDYVQLASQFDFSFIRLEIWGIGEPDKDGENKETRGQLVMERDPQAQALLEMLGKSGHSKNLPDD